MEIIHLQVPRTGNRYLKMLWTTRRIAPVAVCWEFPSTFDCKQALNYIKKQFPYGAELDATFKAPNFILMKHVKLEEATEVVNG